MTNQQLKLRRDLYDPTVNESRKKTVLPPIAKIERPARKGIIVPTISDVMINKPVDNNIPSTVQSIGEVTARLGTVKLPQVKFQNNLFAPAKPQRTIFGKNKFDPKLSIKEKKELMVKLEGDHTFTYSPQKIIVNSAVIIPKPVSK